jgi:hypothetical protein
MRPDPVIEIDPALRFTQKLAQGAIASSEAASSNIAPSHYCINALGCGTLFTSTYDEHSFLIRRLPCIPNPIGRLYLCLSFWQKPLNLAIKPPPPLLRTFAFLDRALEKSPKHTDMSDEILNMADWAKQAYQLFAEVNRDIANLHQEFPKPIS